MTYDMMFLLKYCYIKHKTPFPSLGQTILIHTGLTEPLFRANRKSSSSGTVVAMERGGGGSAVGADSSGRERLEIRQLER